MQNKNIVRIAVVTARILLVPLLAPCPVLSDETLSVTGDVKDDDSGTAIASRVYIQGADGTWYFPNPASPGDVVRYERRNYWDKSQMEMHATVAAKPFAVDLRAGDYTITVERGKEYLPLETKVSVDRGRTTWHLRPVRWIDMASRGWYSGDVHCHRSPGELANLMLAEDLNVCFPLTYWTTAAELPPSRGDKTAAANIPEDLVVIDKTHVWYPRNTEYEIFTVGKNRHTLGAFLILNHRRPFDIPMFPLADVAKQAHEDGALIDLEKHNWEWAAVVAPLLPVNLFELANNHNWRIGFGVKNWGSPAPSWLNLSGPRTIDNERDWIEYGWRFYYGLLNSGLKVAPSAGSASGVHPVPLGYSRVYVHLPQGFNYESWLAGLKAGRSFVTTGPMLLVTVNGRDPGEVFKSDDVELPLSITAEAISSQPLDRIEVIWNGEVVRQVVPKNEPANNGFVTRFEESVPARVSGWLAVRCFGRPLETGGIPFAHTAPWHIKLTGRPMQPKRHEVEYFLGRVEEEISRNRDVLNSEQIADYYKARDFWRRKLAECNKKSTPRQ
jgi:hypothetical protein